MGKVKTEVQNIVLSVTYEGVTFNLEKLSRSLEGQDTTLRFSQA
jgi:hypothetical protein